jgi:hypothetical protein
MTDDLIKRLIDELRACGGFVDGTLISVYYIADALEAQAKLIEWLRMELTVAAEIDHHALTSSLLGKAEADLEAQAKRIAGLERLISDATGMTWQERCRRERERAEKAEADLAAARAALVEVLDWTGSDDRDYPEHAHAIAAARGKHPVGEYLDTNGAALAALVESDEPVKSCKTCRFTTSSCGYSTYVYGCGWQPKSDVCPTCEGTGDISMGNGMYPDCTDCEGTGKKETDDD